MIKTAEVVISFKSESAFLSCFKKIYKKYRSYISLNGFAYEMTLKFCFAHHIREFNKIIASLKKQPSYFVIKY